MKPLGIFATEGGVPGWAQFAMLPDWADFEAAAQRSLRTGLRWVLGLYGVPRAEPILAHVTKVRRRLDAAGLLPFLVGVAYHEEWYGEWKGGRLSIPGLSPANPAHLLPAAAAIRGWCSSQHAVIRAALPGLRVVWIDGYVNDDPSFGGWWYQPVPTGVDVLALECYVHAGGTWAADVEPFLQHAVATRREPVALIVQGFQVPGDPLWSAGPAAESPGHLRRWLDHPRVLSAWVFDWGSRPGLIGLADLPGPRAALERVWSTA